MAPDRFSNAEVPAPRAQPKILVAEDEEMLGALIESKLSHAGYRVILTKDGKAAWTAILAEQPDLIVLDWMMPGIDGLHLLALVRDHPKTKDTPVMMLTAVNQKSEVLTAVDVGASDYMVKPFRPHQLLARIRKLLAPAAKR
jgi:two-component system phosphate regulon response regulator PhoB